MCQLHFGTSCSLRVGSEPSCPHLVVVSERGGFKPSMEGAAQVAAEHVEGLLPRGCAECEVHPWWK